MIDTLFSDLQECAGMGARAFRTRRQLRRDARKDLPNAYAPTPRDVLVRLLCGLVLIASLGVILTGCGGGDIEEEPVDESAGRPPDAMCMWDPRQQPVVYVCNPGKPLPIPATHR